MAIPNQPNGVAEYDSILEGLTDVQAEAVTHVDGPLLVLAGPGSGKTRVITRRIAHLVLHVGIAPWNVLAITFTNKATAEMRQRVEQMLTARQARALTVSTFHSLGARLIRQYADRLGLPTGYSIYDTANQHRAIKQAITDLEINTKNFPPGAVLATISKAKNALLDAAGFAATTDDFFGRTVTKIYAKYEQILQRNHALDFDDLLLRLTHLIKGHADVLASLRERFAYILIDEYQDTNHVQFIIAHALAAPQNNICVTGDPDQSIYRWRGADIRNILDFETQYPNAKAVRLEQNYRSTKHILSAADHLIRENKQRKHKELWTENDPGEPVCLVTCQDERHEAKWVVDQFRQLNDQGILWSDMAVFYRVNSLSRVMEDALRTAKIPYQIARGTSFYERREIKDTVAYLRTIANPADEINHLRIINTPARGISNTTVKALQAHAAAAQMTLTQVLQQPASVPTLHARAVVAVGRFAKLLDGWRAKTESGLEASDPPAKGTTSLSSFIEQVLRESGLEDYYQQSKADPDESRLMNLGELVSSAQQFEDDSARETEDGQLLAMGQKLELFLEQISLVSDVDAVQADQGSVTLMTLHAAKGLEFPVVAIIGVEEGLLPHSQSNDELEEIEEERRLCFVGITRAMQRLFLSHVQYRTIFGQLLPAIPSRFLSELPRDQLVTKDVSAVDDWIHDEDQVRSQRDDARQREVQFSPGTLVRHPQFGLGRVITVRARGAETRARVEFEAAGVKTLILQYARLEKVVMDEQG